MIFIRTIFYIVDRIIEYDILITKYYKALIKRGGGTGPMKPDNRYIYTVPNPAIKILKDERANGELSSFIINGRGFYYI